MKCNCKECGDKFFSNHAGIKTATDFCSLLCEAVHKFKTGVSA
jgi:hypothetical protein